MKPHLLYRDLDLQGPSPPNGEALVQDLELDTVLDAMARGDGYVRSVAERTLLAGLVTPEEIRYREDVVADFLDRPELARRLYELAVEGVETKQKARFFWFRESPQSQLEKSLGMLELLAEVLGRLRRLADEHVDRVRSEGVAALLSTLRRELDDEYLARVDEDLKALRFADGVLVAAGLGAGNRGANYVLRRGERGLLGRLTPDWADGMSFAVSKRNEHGMRALGELRGRGVALVASALAQSTDHVLAFFEALRAEAAFYVACLNLRDRLAERGYSVCLPEPAPQAERALAARGLYDPALALRTDAPVVATDLDADGASLVMITGANEGGKSTFLRAVGVAALMLRAGMFVAADELRASVCSGVFTHFKREEDAGMRSGKLDEELRRMSAIADEIAPGGLLLCNESFASTNEAEGSEIARQVVRAFVDEGVGIVFVTHMYDLASGFSGESALFLRAERLPDGERTFRIVPGEPEPTSYGLDSYRRVFGHPTRRTSRSLQ